MEKNNDKKRIIYFSYYTRPFLFKNIYINFKYIRENLYYLKTDNHYFNIKDILKVLYQQKEIEYMTNINNFIQNENTNNVIHLESNNAFWESFKDRDFTTIDNLELVLGIKSHNMPEDAELRTKILTNFANDRDSQYKVEYEKLYNYSEDFRDRYPLDRVLHLIKTTITNMQNYIIDINHSNLSEEDKALLFFVIPM